MKKILKSLKKGEVAIYAIAIMLVAAGYLNYSTKSQEEIVETFSKDTSNNVVENTSIGDATLVNSDDILEEALVENNDIEEKDVIEETVETNSEQVDYFTESKLERDTNYASMISNYTAILEKDKVSDVEKKIAMQEITNINNTKNAIMICENLLSTKGFTNSIVLVNKESVNVVVQLEGDLDTQKVAQIQNIISRELNAQINNVHISEK